MAKFEISVNGEPQEPPFDGDNDEAANRHAALIRKGSPNATIVVYEIDGKKHERFFFEKKTTTKPASVKREEEEARKAASKK